MNRLRIGDRAPVPKTLGQDRTISRSGRMRRPKVLITQSAARRGSFSKGSNMTSKQWISACGIVALVLAVPLAQAQSAVRVRGTITAVSADTLSVKSRDGRDLTLVLPPDATVAVAKAARFEDIKPGDYVGTTANPGPDGTLVAVEVHYLPPTAAEGHTPWDLTPGSTMTNAKVGEVQATGKREILLTYKDGAKKVVVPPEAAIVRAVPGTRADLVVGQYVFVSAQAQPDGTLTAPRIQVSKDGVKPPQ